MSKKENGQIWMITLKRDLFKGDLLKSKVDMKSWGVRVNQQKLIKIEKFI